MAGDEEEDEAEPAVQLGDDPPVAGAPISRVASRISWPRARSDILASEGGTEIRTSDGPTPLESILADSDVSYFARRQEFVDEVREVIGYGPVPTEEREQAEDEA